MMMQITPLELPMSLDLTTLYLVATLICALLGCLLLYFGRQEGIQALAWWGSAYLLGAASIAVWALLGNTFALVLAAFGFVACAMMWNAARVFHGCKPNWPGLFLGAIVWLAAIAILPIEAAPVRVTIGAAIVAIYATLTASQLAAERRKAMRRRWPTIAIPLLHGTVLMLPIVLGDLLWSPEGGGFTSSAWVMAFAIEMFLYAVGTVFVIFMLVSERTVRAHKAAAFVDPLTGMFNRRGFADATARMIKREADAGRQVTVMIFDIDHFKSVNDRFGHPAGDEVLRLFSAIVTSTLRVTDLCGRIGGEEFAALLPCPIDEAMVAAERVRTAFESSGIAVDDTPIVTTVSIGVASGAARTELDVLLAAADTGLYQAKRGGRNRVVATEDPLSAGDTKRIAADKSPSPQYAVVRRGPVAADSFS